MGDGGNLVMKRKLLSFMLSATMVAGVLSGCGSTAATTTEAPATEEIPQLVDLK